MDYRFFENFALRIQEVYNRDPLHWEQFNYTNDRPQTAMHILAYVYSGEGGMEYRDRSYTLSGGVLFQISPGHRLLIRTTPERPLHYVSFCFQYGLVRWDGSSPTWENSSAPLPLPTVMSPARLDGIPDIFTRADRLWREKNKGYEWHVKLAFLDIIKELEHLDGVAATSDATVPRHAEKAIEFMKRNYPEPLTRDLIAGHVSLSPGYFSLMFKRQTGLSPIQYLNRIRLDQAKALLKTSRLPISQIAQEVGFADSFYFTRLFTRQTGLSPRDFRNG